MAALRDVYQAANKLGEAPIWHAASKRLLWIDLYDPKLFIHDPAKGETLVREISLKAPLGAISATANSKLLIVSHAGGLSTFNIKTGATKIFARPEQDRDAIIYNDCYGSAVRTPRKPIRAVPCGVCCPTENASLAMLDSPFPTARPFRSTEGSCISTTAWARKPLPMTSRLMTRFRATAGC
jgi:hypothetical protein